MLLVQENDSEAFSVLYDRYSTEMVNFFFHRLGQDEAKAQDFLQDLFLKILNNPDHYNPEKPFRPWIFSVALNMCKNEYRSLKVREDYRIAEWMVAQNPVNPVSDKVDLKWFEIELAEKLLLLDEPHRQVFLLRFRQEHSISEIAELLGCPEGTVKSRLFYTLKALSEQLKVFNTLIN